MTDYDSPWKEILDLYFESFLAFCFPQIHREINWSRGYELLDKELQQIVREADQGRRAVDLLVKVWLSDGREAWVLIHVEVQTWSDQEFSKRMYVYHYRLYDRYNRSVVSLAVLGDDQMDWRPDRYGYTRWGCMVDFRFPMIKLLDYIDRIAELEIDRNPFAVVILTHLKTLETRGDQEQRRRWKIRLAKSLYERGYSRQQVLHLFRFIDWIMDLPAHLEQSFWLELRAFEQEKQMPFVTIAERFGREEGLREGLLAGIEIGLNLRFGASGQELLPEIQRVADVDQLTTILHSIQTVSSPAELRRLWS